MVRCRPYIVWSLKDRIMLLAPSIKCHLRSLRCIRCRFCLAGSVFHHARTVRIMFIYTFHCCYVSAVKACVKLPSTEVEVCVCFQQDNSRIRLGMILTQLCRYTASVQFSAERSMQQSGTLHTPVTSHCVLRSAHLFLDQDKPRRKHA